MDYTKEWAVRALRDECAVILDTETTGLGKEDQVIEIGVIDLAGNVLFERRVCPSVVIHPAAEAVHGITPAMVSDCPTFDQIAGELRQVIEGRRVLIYNAAFDLRLLRQTYRAFGLPCQWLNRVASDCVMRALANGGKWRPLRGGDHSAVGDCRATLAVLKAAAGVHPCPE